MFDAGLVLYIGLLVLFIWRFLSGWRLCGAWLEYANYCMLLYGLLLFLNLWAIVSFLSLASKPEGKQVWETLPGVAHPLMMGAPVAALAVFAMAFLQTGQHVNEIRRGAGVLKHDRAVQIIALPAVFGCMAMNALANMYECAAKGDVEDSFKLDVPLGQNATAAGLNRKQFYLAQTETCYQVGDLYEAWALFQFCRMTMDILRSSLKKVSRESAAASSSAELRQEAKGLLVAHTALEDIAYVGVMMFLVVCLSEAGWSLYLLTFTVTTDNWASYNGSMGRFQAAGLVSSMAAIYNVNKVEVHFHSYFQGYGPLLKFLTVKILLSLAYFQKGCIYVLQAINNSLPGLLQNAIQSMPVLRELVSMNQTEFYLLYSSVVLYECVIGVILHWFAWPADESFYDEAPLEEKEGGPALAESEKKALLAAQP